VTLIRLKLLDLWCRMTAENKRSLVHVVPQCFDC
jgi:hypothetical protein